MSRVSVFVMDCTDMGAPLPMATLPALMRRERLISVLI
jgi:hypothetical protein